LKPIKMVVSLSGEGRDWSISRLSAETPGERLFVSDSLKSRHGKLQGNFRVENLNLARLFGEQSGVSGALSLLFESTDKGASLLSLGGNRLQYRDMRLDYLKVTAEERNGIATLGKCSFGFGDFTGDLNGRLLGADDTLLFTKISDDQIQLEVEKLRSSATPRE